MLMMVYTQPIACPDYIEGQVDNSAAKKALFSHSYLQIFFTSEHSVNSVKQSGQIICKVLVDYDHLEISENGEYALINSEDILLLTSVFLDRSEEVSCFHYSYIPNMSQFSDRYMVHLFNNESVENNLLPLTKILDMYCCHPAAEDRARLLKGKLKEAAEGEDHYAFFDHVEEEMFSLIQANVKPNEYYFIILLMVEAFQQNHYLLKLSLEQRKKLVLLQGKLYDSQLLLESQSSIVWRLFSFFTPDDYHGERQAVIADAILHAESLEMIERILLNQRDQLEDKHYRACLAIPEKILSKRWTNPEFMKNKNKTGEYYKAILSGLRLIVGTKNLAVTAYERENWTFTETSVKSPQRSFHADRVLYIQNLLNNSVSHLFEAISDWEPKIAIRALQILEAEENTDKVSEWLEQVELQDENNKEFREIYVPVKQLLDILSHPYPQNRTESYPYVMPEQGYVIYKFDRDRVDFASSNGGLVLKNGRVVGADEIIRNDERDNFIIAKERPGILSLTAYEDNHVAPVTKEFVVSYIKSIIQKELRNQNLKLSLAVAEAGASSSSSVSSSPVSSPSTSFSSSPSMSLGNR